MKKIRNPFLKSDFEPYQCFGCSPFNNHGLMLEFFEDEEFIYTEWKPQARYEGYIGNLHGGIQATILDEIASWVVYIKCQTAGVTASMEVKYRKPVPLQQEKIKVKAKLVEQTSRIVKIQAVLLNEDEQIATEAQVRYFIFPEKIAREKYNYPGIESFFSKSEV